MYFLSSFANLSPRGNLTSLSVCVLIQTFPLCFLLPYGVYIGLAVFLLQKWGYARRTVLKCLFHVSVCCGLFKCVYRSSSFLLTAASDSIVRV